MAEHRRTTTYFIPILFGLGNTWNDGDGLPGFLAVDEPTQERADSWVAKLQGNSGTIKVTGDPKEAPGDGEPRQALQLVKSLKRRGVR